MRKVILLTVLFSCYILNAQIHSTAGNIKTKSNFDFTNEDYIGFWDSEHATHLVIWKDCNNNMQMVEFSSTSGVPLDIISLNFNKNNLYVKTNFKKTNWTTESEFTFVDKTTLTCTIVGNENDPVIYKKVR
jgi:hypothetical protein